MKYGDLLLVIPVLVPLCVAGIGYFNLGYKQLRLLSLSTPLALAFTAIAARQSGPGERFGSIVYDDALTSFMLMITSLVSLVAVIASWSYLDDQSESKEGYAKSNKERYLALFQIFLAAMSMAIVSNNLGIIWVSVEATTISTAFLVAHKGTSQALEAAWKYVIICSFGITIAFLGTVLLYFSATHAGISAGNALDLQYLIRSAPKLDNNTTRLALALLLLGFGAKVGLVPFHTWIADAHSQAPAPVSALMSGVLLSVAFSIVLRLQLLARLSIGAGLYQKGLLVMGLSTIVVAALLLVRQRDFKRLFAYSSLENMGLIAVAASIGSQAAILALLLQIFAHGIAKATAFISAGQLQHRVGSTSIGDVTSLVRRSPVLGAALLTATLALLGFPPFAIFLSETSIAYSINSSSETVILVIVAIALTVGFGSIVRHLVSMLFSSGASEASFTISHLERTPLIIGISVSLYVGIFAHPLLDIATRASLLLGQVR